MEIVLLTIRLLLAGVFGIAGIAKIMDPAGSRRALVDFGVPERIAVTLGQILPIAEIIVALALIPLDTAWWGALGATGLLLAFTAGIGVNLTRGNSPDCHCFGQLHSKPVSWSVFARNLGLAAAAGVIVAQGKGQSGLSALTWLVSLKPVEAVNLFLGIIAVALLAAMYIFLRKMSGQQAILAEKIEAMKKVIDDDYAEVPPVEREDAVAPIEGLPVGAPAPSFSLSALGGEPVTLDDLLHYGKSVLLLFVSPNCSPCKTLLPFVRAWDRDYSDHLTIAVLSKGTPEENRKRIAKYGTNHFLLQGETGVAAEYQAMWTPSAVLIDRQGKIASQMVQGNDEIRSLVTHTISTDDFQPVNNGDAIKARRPLVAVGNSLFKVGEPAPRFSLTVPTGQVMSADDLLGRETLLLFWNPKCPFCQGMSDDLKRWEDNPPKGAPQLVFVSSDNAEEANFRSQFLHDPEFDLGALFGTNSTPSAVLIDADGKIASSLAVGERNILPLLGIRKVRLPIAASV